MPIVASHRARAGRAVRVLYYYGSLHFDTGSPKALVGMIDLLDRSVFAPVFLTTGDGPLRRELVARQVEIVSGTATSVSLKEPWTFLRRVRQQAHLLRTHRIDLLHVNEFGADLDLVLGAWWAGIPIVLHFHNAGAVSATNLHRFAADRVLFVSEAQKSDVAGFERIAAKSEVLYNSIDLSIFAPRTQPPSADVVVVTVAQISHRKGIDVLLEAARELVAEREHLRFVIVGRAGVNEEDYAARMEAIAASDALLGRVTFLGARSDVAAILRDADIFFFPVRAEPFGIAVTEAMATGLPVVATGTGGITEILSSPDYGITVPEGATPSVFAAALRSVVDAPDRGRAMGERGRASLTGRFDQATIGAQLQRLYLGLLDA